MYWKMTELLVEEIYEKMMFQIFRAADGGNYGIFVCGLLPDKDDLIVMEVVNGQIAYEKEPRRLDLFKASYRYRIPELHNA